MDPAREHAMTIESRHAVPLAVALLFAPALAHAQGSFPAKPIRLIVPYPPAGSTHFVGRQVGAKMSESLGHQIIIDNRPGAGTLLGLQLGAAARADGYTMTFATSAGLAVNPALGVKMPFEPLRDFAPVGLLVY